MIPLFTRYRRRPKDSSVFLVLGLMQFLLISVAVLIQNAVVSDGFIFPSKLTVSESSKLQLNDSFIGHVGVDDGRNIERPAWTDNSSGSDPEVQISKYWSQLQYAGSRLTELNVSTVNSLSSFLHEFADVQLGVTETKNNFNSISFDVRRVPSLTEQAQSLAKKFSVQLQSYHEALERMVVSVKSDQFRAGPPQLPKCCELKTERFKFSDQYNMDVWEESACWTVASKIKPSIFVPGLNFGEAILNNAQLVPHLKWQYFVSPEGVYVEYPANIHHCKTTSTGSRPVVSTKGHPERKMWLIQKANDDSRIHRIVFLIQLGKSPTTDMIKSVKNIVMMLMRFMDESDEVGILNDEPDQLWSNFLCEQLVPVTSWTRYQILSYLNYIEHLYKSPTTQSNSVGAEDDEADASYGMHKAIDIACANFSETAMFPPSAATIIHLTARVDTTMIQNGYQVACPVFIETFLLKNANESEEERYKKSLQSVASKNIWTIQVFSINQTEPESFAVKVAFKLNSKKEWWSLSDILSQFFPQEKDNLTAYSDFSLPHWNPISKEAVIVGKKYVFTKGRPVGLVAIEIPIVHFTQHVTYFANENVCDSKNYAFLIDSSGRVIAHPALGRPDVTEEVLSPIQIEQIEIYHGFLFLKRQFLSQGTESGCHSLRLGKDSSWVTYAWSRLYDYVVVVVAFGESGGCAPDKEQFFLRKASLSPKSDVQHHLLQKMTHCCEGQFFSTAKASLYLAPTAFNEPAEAIASLRRYNSKRSLSLMAYLGDNSGLLQNQNKGVKLAVKDHIGALASIVPTWKARFYTSSWNKYILTRFGSAAGGSFILLHPGSSITPGFVPHSTVWFRKAVDGGGKLIFSTSAVDSQGIPTFTMSLAISVTISSEFTNQKKAASVAVLGAKLNVGFFQKIVEAMLPECRNKSMDAQGESRRALDTVSVRCFLLDESGFVVYHPHLKKGLKGSSQIHVTQVEPLSVIDILQYGQSYEPIPMRKHTCHKLSEASATQGSLQRIYTLSMGPEGIQKFKTGDLCSRYYVLPVPETNLFLGVVQDGCSSPAAFCPCSTVDKLCLNCFRIELSDCECPCECPREPNFCAKQYMNLPDDVEPCEFPPESLPMIRSSETWGCENGKPGGTISCGGIRSPCFTIMEYEACIGSWDCDWCQPAKANASTCMSYRECYDYEQGKLGGQKEVALGEVGGTALDAKARAGDKTDGDTQITVVPILGVLSVFLVFLGLVVYCYRHRSLSASSSQPDVHLLPLQESPMGSIIPQAGSSRSESDTEADNEPLHMVYLQRNPRNLDHVFLYPPRSPLGSVMGTDSDHGYSTMTHNDDSECGAPLPLVYLELPPQPRLARTEPKIALLETLTDNCNSLSPTTQVPQVLVPVSVHPVT